MNSSRLASSLVSFVPVASLALILAGTASCSRASSPPATQASNATGLPTETVALQPSAHVSPLPTRDELKARRAQQIERLTAYAQAGVFPRNFPQVNHVHMFKDPDDHFCAVANLLHQDGRDDVVDRIALTDNSFEVATEDDTDVDAWIRTSGLTREEVARIQAPAPSLGIFRMPSQKTALPIAKTAPPPAATLTEAEMTAALRSRIETVKAELVANTDASLDKAMIRLADAPI